MSAWGVFQGSFAGVDQGTDWSSPGHIPALGNATVTDVGSASIIEGGSYPYVIYKLGGRAPAGGSRYVYVAENFTPTVQIGDKVKRGQQIGVAKGAYPYIEVGFNRGPSGWDPVAPLDPDPHSPKPAGQAMANLIGQTVGRTIGSPSTGLGVGSGSIYQAPPRPGGSQQDGATAQEVLFGIPGTGSILPGTDNLLPGLPGPGAIWGGVSSLWNGVSSVGDIFGAVREGIKVFLWLVNPKHWAMMAEVLVGSVLIGLGIYWLGSGEAPDIPFPLLGGLGKAGKAAGAAAEL